jgi:hypothetical protein
MATVSNLLQAKVYTQFSISVFKKIKNWGPGNMNLGNAFLKAFFYVRILN